LQQGRYGKAMELLKNQVAFEKELSSPSARFHLLEMKGHYLFETDNWTDQVVSIAVKTDDLALRSRAVNDLIDGTAAFKKKNNKKLATTIARLESDISRSEQQMKANEDVTVCGVKRYVNNIVSPGDLKFCRNILFELEALKKWADGDYKGAETFFEKAIANEKGYIIGPPVLLKPVHELYGEFLLTQNRPAEALKQFEASLARAPKRVLSLKGQLNAARLIKSEKKMEMQNELKAMLKHADAEAIKGV
jgi:tetratricopeptide (TPR) repeat protein